MSWLSQFIAWLSPASNEKADNGTGVGLGKNIQERSSAKSALAAEQAELAHEIERLFLAYDERVREVSMRVRDLRPDAAEEEIARLRDVQKDLQMVVRRLDAAIKSRQELEQELSSWRNRGQDREQVRRRAEIIRSELAVRGLGMVEDTEDIQPIQIEDFVKDRPKTNILAGAEKEIEAIPVYVEDEDEQVEPLHIPDVEHLLAAIREATREAERWHAIPVEDHDDEALLQVRHVKELNGLLKKLDRKQGISRDRIEMAICPREYR